MFSCGQSTNNESSKTSDSAEYSNNGIEKLPFKVLTFEDKILTSLGKTEGDFYFGEKWQDANGYNVIVYTKSTTFVPWKDADGPDMGDYTAYLKAYHFKSSDEKNWEQVRLVQDFSEPCGSPPFGLEFDFCIDNISITDENEDGYAEVIFAYHFQCASELSPKIMKLMMLENGEKYPIRGESYADYGFQITGGTTNIGEEFDNAPDGFEEFALKKWKEIQYSISYIEADKIKFADFWDNFLKIIKENDKAGLKKISKAGGELELYFSSDWKKDIDKFDISQVQFTDGKTATLGLDLNFGYGNFKFEQINGEWFIKEFNAAG